MKPNSEVTAIVIDQGLFLPLAIKLSKSYKRVLYYSPWREGFPKLSKCIIGDGFENVERCNDFYKVKNEIDLWIFPDIHFSGLQTELELQGEAVWGSRSGDSLELNRRLFLQTLKEAGLEVPPHRIVIGLDKLRDLLKLSENKYIKISKYRGNIETFHWRNWDLDESTLDLLAVRFGPAKEYVPFLVFDAIETDIEIGADTYCVDGKWPNKMLQGYEYKDKAYIGAVTDTPKMPDHIHEVLEAFSPVLKGYGYRNQFSMELRVKDSKSYFIDATCRGGLPSTASQMELWKNLPDIIWQGAHGQLVEPEPSALFSAECALTLKSEKGCWSCVEVPEDMDDSIKLASSCQIDGKICFPSEEQHGDDVGWLVSTGDTIREAISSLLDKSKNLPEGLTANTEKLIDVLKEIENAETDGIEFTEQPVPKPEIVVTESD